MNELGKTKHTRKKTSSNPIPECSTSQNRMHSPTDEENLFENPGVRFSSDSYQSSMRQNQYDRDYNNILSERL